MACLDFVIKCRVPCEHPSPAIYASVPDSVLIHSSTPVVSFSIQIKHFAMTRKDFAMTRKHFAITQQISFARTEKLTSHWQLTLSEFVTVHLHNL